MRACLALLALGLLLALSLYLLPYGAAPPRTTSSAPASAPPLVGAGASPTGGLASAPLAPALRLAPIAGSVYRYRVDLTQQTCVEMDGKGQTAAIRLLGELAVRVLVGPAAPIALEHDLAGLHANADGVDVDLPSGIALRLDGRGRILGARLRSGNARPQGRNLARALATLLQATLPEPAAGIWEAQEQDLAGTCLARYQIEPGGAITKTRNWPAWAMQAEGALHLGLRADGMIESLEGAEVLRTTGGEAEAGSLPLALSSRLEVSVRLTAVESFPAAGPPSPVVDAAWETILVAETPEPARGPTPELQPVLLALERAHQGGRWEDEAPRGFLQLARLLAASDAAVAEALESLRRGRLAEPVARALVEALGEAGTPTAQAALLACMDEPACARLAPLACLCLGEADRPLNETVQRLETTAGSEDQALHQGAVQGIGVLAARSGDVPLADRLAGRLEALLPADSRDGPRVEGLLVALGNAGRLRSLAAIVPFLTSPDPALRLAATGALRRLPGPATWAHLATVARQDQEPAVRREAILALAGRTDPEVGALLVSVLTEDPAAWVRLAALEEAVQRGLMEPVAQARLDPDPEVRAAAHATPVD